MTTMPIFICDRCGAQVEPPHRQPHLHDDNRVRTMTEPPSLNVLIPAILSGQAMASEAVGLTYCANCQPLVAALLVGLFDASVVATRVDSDTPIDLGSTLTEFIRREVPDYVYAGLADA